MEKPPVIAEPKESRNMRWAWTLNLLVPGAGQLLVGQIVLGSILCALFIADFTVMVGVFLSDFARFLKLVTSGQILQGDTIEQAGNAYHVTWLLILLGIGMVIYVISFVSLARKERKPNLDRPS